MRAWQKGNPFVTLLPHKRPSLAAVLHVGRAPAAVCEVSTDYVVKYTSKL